MGEYEITDPDTGATYRVQMGAPPTDDDVKQIFSMLRQSAPKPAATAKGMSQQQGVDMLSGIPRTASPKPSTASRVPGRASVPPAPKYDAATEAAIAQAGKAFAKNPTGTRRLAPAQTGPKVAPTVNPMKNLPRPVKIAGDVVGNLVGGIPEFLVSGAETAFKMATGAPGDLQKNADAATDLLQGAIPFNQQLGAGAKSLMRGEGFDAAKAATGQAFIKGWSDDPAGMITQGIMAAAPFVHAGVKGVAKAKAGMAAPAVDFAGMPEMQAAGRPEAMPVKPTPAPEPVMMPSNSGGAMAQARAARLQRQQAAPPVEPAPVPEPVKQTAETFTRPAEPVNETPKSGQVANTPENLTAFTIEPYRYAKDSIVIKTPGIQGFKTPADWAAEAIGGRYVGRAGGYVVKASKEAAYRDRMAQELQRVTEAQAQNPKPTEPPLPPVEPPTPPTEATGAIEAPPTVTEPPQATTEPTRQPITMAQQEAMAQEIGYDLPDRADFKQGHSEVIDAALKNRDALEKSIASLDPESDILPSREHRAVAALLQQEAQERATGLMREQQETPDTFTPDRQAALDSAIADTARYGKLLYRTGSEAGRNLAFQKMGDAALFDAGKAIAEAEDAIGMNLSPEARREIARLSEAGKQAVARTEESLMQSSAQLPKARRVASRRIDAKAPDFGAENAVFTRDRLEAARARLKELQSAKGSNLSIGFAPGELEALVDIGGYYVEGGLRTFTGWAKAIREDIGDLPDAVLQNVWARVQADKRLASLGEPTQAPQRNSLLDAATLEYARGAQKVDALARSLKQKYGQDVPPETMQNLFRQAADAYRQNYAEVESIKAQMKAVVAKEMQKAHPSLLFDESVEVPKPNLAQGLLAATKDGRYRNSYAVDKAAGDAMNRLAAAEDTGLFDAGKGADEAARAEAIAQEQAIAYEEASNTLRSTTDAQGNPLAVQLPSILDKPKAMVYGGRMHQTSVVLLSDGKGGTKAFVVPKEVAVDFNDAAGWRSYRPTGIENGITRALAEVASLSTSITLATPVEAVAHLRRIGTLAAAVPPVDASPMARAVELAVPYFGPRIGFLTRLVRQDMSAPENQAVLRDLIQANAGSSRAFSQEMAHKNVLTKLPVVGKGIDKMQHATHELMFGLPEGKGIKGFDLRTRVLLENIRRTYEGNTDPKRMREFTNQVGQYTRKPDTLVEQARKVNPFAATNLPARLTEQRQLLGQSGLKSKTTGQAAALTAETALRHAILPSALLVMLNRHFSGHWPWENAPGHEQDLEVGADDDGKPIYLSSSIMLPTLTRALRDNGVLDLYRLTASGQFDATNAVDAEGKALANTGMSVLNSPMASAAMTAATGRALYLTASGDLLHTTSPREESINGMVPTRLKAAALKSNSVIGGMAGAGHGSGEPIARQPFAAASGGFAQSVMGPMFSKAGDAKESPYAQRFRARALDTAAGGDRELARRASASVRGFTKENPFTRESGVSIADAAVLKTKIADAMAKEGGREGTEEYKAARRDAMRYLSGMSVPDLRGVGAQYGVR